MEEDLRSHFRRLRWTPERRDKIEGDRGHGVSADEVDEVFEDERHRVFRLSRARYVLAGRTAGGRRVIVILEDEGGSIAAPISAREPNDRERRQYFG
jgi:uncharacterized DUF497 family protein